MTGHRENELLRRALALYAGDHVLAKVLKEGENFLSPNARSVELTMLFFDIASFTTRDKCLTPELLRDWLGSYAEIVTGVIAQSKGTFDTFIGDAGSAWWGEDAAADHPAQAIACARELLNAIDQFNARNANDYPSIRLMVGVNTSFVSLGNIGSSSRLRYCPIGDAVNLTSRLCAMSATYRRSVILTEATYGRLDEHADIEYLESVSVKGRPEPLRIYGLGPWR